MTIESIMPDDREYMMGKYIQSYYMRGVKVNVSNANKIIRIMNYNKDEDEQRNEKIVLQHTEQVQKSISN